MNIFLEKFIKKKFKTPGLALDLGSGNGNDVACLKQLGWKAYGVDKKDNDLNEYYKSNKKFNLVYSNYVLQFIKNKKAFIRTCFGNLKNDGRLFIQTFDKTDKNIRLGIDKKKLRCMLKSQGFVDIKTKTFSFYDNDPGHKHWHKILEITARKVIK